MSLFNVRPNLLDLMLFGIGHRLSYLSQNPNDDYLTLVDGKQKTLQFVSADGVARYYFFDNGKFEQTMGKADSSDVIIHFKDSRLGAKLLLKDTKALMQAVQEGDITITGDIKLVLWFGQIAKHACTLPEHYRPYIDRAKPYLKKVRPALLRLTDTLKRLADNKRP